MPNLFRKAVASTFGVLGGYWTRYGGQGWGRIQLFQPGSRFDYERDAGDLWSNSVVSLGLAWLGDRFPRPVMQVSRIARNGEYRPIGRHKLVDLWNRPNPYYGRRTLEKAVGLSLKVDGNAYIYKMRSRGGEVAQLWWIPHNRIVPTWPSDGSEFIDGYKVWTDGGAPQSVPKEDIVHIRDGIDPRNERFGLSALRSNLREVCTVNQESGYTASVLRNMGVPGLMVVPDDPTGNLRPSPEDAQSIKTRISESFSGDNSGKTVVLAGRYRVEPVGFSPEQMMLDRLPQSAIARIGSAIGVAAMSLGLPDPNKTYANLAEANRSSWGTVVAIQELIDEALRWELLPDFGDDPYKVIVERDYSHIQELQESLDAVHLRTREDWKAGIITRGEAREQLGYNGDGDDTPEYTGEFDDKFFPGTGGEDPPLPEVDPFGGVNATADAEPVEPDEEKPQEDEKPKPKPKPKPEDDAKPDDEKAEDDAIETKADDEIVIDGIVVNL